jgi:hypothetical protein
MTGDVYEGLRGQVLNLKAEQLGPEYAGVPLLALVMEWAQEPASVTLVAVADGTTSLYFSTGGGIIGAGQHEAVAAASREWLEAGTAHLDAFHPAVEPQLPGPGETQFVAVTPAGLRSASAIGGGLEEGRHALSPLWAAAQDVITQMRLVQGG